MLGNALLVGGSTDGKGIGFGTYNITGDIDGFVAKLSKETGDLLDESYRIQSGTMADDFVHGLCASENGDSFVYVSGSSVDSTEGGESRAYLTKLRVVDMMPMWTINLRAEHVSSSVSPKVAGVSCAVSDDESFVYFAGNVEDGGFIADGNITGSAGGSDIFIAKVDGQTVRAIALT